MPADRELRDDATPQLSQQLSWVAFNRRVFSFATDPGLPLLERVRFLGICAENLDGFFQRRVGSLQREIAQGGGRRTGQPLTPAEELDQVRAAVRALEAEMVACWREQLRPELEAAGVHLVEFEQLTASQREQVDRYFQEQVYPILTPLAVDPARPFPYISNLSLSLAVVLRYEDDPPLFARVKVPANRPRWVPVDDGAAYVRLEQVIAGHLGQLFRGMTILSATPFRLTRSSEVPRDEASADDIFDFMVGQLRRRRFAPVVRLELDAAMPVEPRELLQDELELDPADVYETAGPLGLTDLRQLAAIERPDLKPPVLTPARHPKLSADLTPEQVFAAIHEQDILLHHPYHAFDATTIPFIAAAASDPAVVGIKQSLYRTSPENEVLEQLLQAVDAGKEVTVLLELKARLGEASNIQWAKRLEERGVHTSYGFVGFKSHTRMTLVTRQEADQLRQYLHFSTGDYNPVTARFFSDVAILTADPELTADVHDFFNFLTGARTVPDYRRLVTAPSDMRTSIVAAIDREIDHARRQPGAGRITAMMNALVDEELTAKLYQASGAGVECDLIVRRECGLQPGLTGISERIRVRSVLGANLEHARIFCFHNDGDEQVYIGSADWMHRNLDHRVEAMLAVDDPTHKRALISLLELFLADNQRAWELQPDGDWRRVEAPAGATPVDAQATLAARYGVQPIATQTSPSSTLTG